MPAQERRDVLVHPPRRRLPEDADGDGPAAQRGELPDAPGRILQRGEAPRGVRRERAPRLCRDHAAARPDEEVRAERVLQLADLLGHRGLRDAERGGRGRE
jgi:hypothetical protein